MLKPLSIGVASALLLSACSNPGQETPAPDPAPALKTADADGPAIRTDAACNAAFLTPQPGLKVLFRGPVGDRLWIEHEITAVENGRAHAASTMLMGPERTRGPSHELVRRDGFVTVEGGTSDARRLNAYGPQLTAAAIHGLRPGGGLTTTITESSDFAGPAGKRDVRGDYVVTFLGCSDLDVGGARTPVKVFEVRSVSRAYDQRAAEGERDRIRQTLNRYWVSERLGWVLRTDDSGGSIIAHSLEPSA